MNDQAVCEDPAFVTLKADVDNLKSNSTTAISDLKTDIQHLSQSVDVLAKELREAVLTRIPPWVAVGFTVCGLIIGGLGTALALK